MNESILRKKKIFITCPNCKGHKGIYGKSALGHPATLPCPECDATGEVEQGPITTITYKGKGTPLQICICDWVEDECPVHPKQDMDQIFHDQTKKFGW